MENLSSLPSRKWWATQVTALTGLFTSWILVAGWNQQLSIAAVTLIGQALVGYLIPVSSTPARPAEAVPGTVSAPVGR